MIRKYYVTKRLGKRVIFLVCFSECWTIRDMAKYMLRF